MKQKINLGPAPSRNMLFGTVLLFAFFVAGCTVTTSETTPPKITAETLIEEAELAGGKAVVSNPDGSAALVDKKTGISIKLDAGAVAGLEPGDSFVLQVIPIAAGSEPANTDTIKVAGQIFNINIKSVKNGNELQPSGGMQVTLPYNEKLSAEQVLKLAIGNYHASAWHTFAVASIDEDTKTISGKITKLSPTGAVENSASNSAPVAPDYAYSSDEEKFSGIKVVATDADGDTLTYSWVDGSTGKLGDRAGAIDSEGNFTHFPPEHFNGIDEFTYQVSDGVLSAQGKIKVTVNAVNDVPQANATVHATVGNFGSVGTFNATDPDNTSGDPDNAPLQFTIVKQPENGAVAVGNNGEFTYTPNPNYEGDDTFYYKVGDGSAESVSATATVSVTAQYRYVLATPSGAKDGSSWNDATNVVQDAIDSLTTLGGGRVLIGPGTFYSAGNSAPVAKITANNPIDLYGGFNGYNITFDQRPEVDATVTVLSGDADQSGTHSAGDSAHVIDTYYSRIDGLTIEGGNANDAGETFGKLGGGVLHRGGALVINQAIIRANTAETEGGGIAAANQSQNAGDTLVIYSSYISDNTAGTKGGGLYVKFDAKILNTTLASNHAADGGGIYNAVDSGKALQLTATRITDNASTSDGGGIYNNGDLIVDHSWITSNESDENGSCGSCGGGIYNRKNATFRFSQIDYNSALYGAGIENVGTLVLEDSSVSHNKEAEYGGALYNENGEVLIVRSRLNHNVASAYGGAIYNEYEEMEPGEGEGDGPPGDGDGPPGDGEGDGEDPPGDGEEEPTPDEGTPLDACPHTNGTLMISHTQFASNRAWAGGAISDGGFSCISFSDFVSNVAQDGRGGAIANEGGSASIILAVTSSTFSYNQAISNSSGNNGYGGAIYSLGNVTNDLRNVSFYGNSAGNGGGAIYAYQNIMARIYNFSFYGNTAPTGHDVFVGKSGPSLGDVYLQNGCSVQDIEAYNDGFSFVGHDSGHLATDVTLLTTDPFERTASGQLFIDQSSPCAEQGSNPIATTAFTELGLDWNLFTSDIDNVNTESDGINIAAGGLYDPSDVWIETLSATASDINWEVNDQVATCYLTNDENNNKVELTTGFPTGTFTSHGLGSGAVVTMTCPSTVSYAKSATAVVP